ncbi:hypothetical protein J6590_063681 [Homalodisca vitripennis]|nr:hypothetical protein J6590_063681 [Homalodisca vitripennis]
MQLKEWAALEQWCGGPRWRPVGSAFQFGKSCRGPADRGPSCGVRALRPNLGAEAARCSGRGHFTKLTQGPEITFNSEWPGPGLATAVVAAIIEGTRSSITANFLAVEENYGVTLHYSRKTRLDDRYTLDF